MNSNKLRIFNIILMRYFGHVGIAIATTIAAFVSLSQYVLGLKKRGFWSFSRKLVIQMNKIVIISLMMGVAVWFGNKMAYQYWLDMLQNKWFLFCYLGVLGFFAIAFFMILAKLFKVINFNEIIALMRRKNGKI